MTGSDLLSAGRAGRIVVTGASGFVGRAVAARLIEDGYAVVAPVRNLKSHLPDGVYRVAGPDLGPSADWPIADAEVVVHCAARVHLVRDPAANPLAAFRRANVEGTMRLAQQAAARGVRRFVFISSIGVNGRETVDRPFTADDEPAPHTPYAISKLEAELALHEIGGRTGMQIVIIRPPLVYGPAAPGNFRTLATAVRRGLPLPFGAIDNRRSLVSVSNIADLISRVVSHPAAADRVLLVSDGEDVSTPELVRRLARAMDRTAQVFSVPIALLEWGAGAVGRREVARQLCRSLQVDISQTRRLLGWSPPLGLDRGLRAAI